MKIGVVMPQTEMGNDPGAIKAYAEAVEDGRPYFVVPWNDQYLIGTTDTPVEDPDEDVRRAAARASSRSRPPGRTPTCRQWVAMRRRLGSASFRVV